ncbi:hypothetical protein F7Q99_31900 [Streptomyces kaniharaensis]|uniref:Uncharacterized protein n=1 Tax=Streptomyces kaniharaensis TaxID=212423 RepID=A0A6N7L1F6_9ACTN|nr:hypothetical protein [Streptomyces kaniharaensis]MQS16669.1 hypothetical protein [Streptomyces kaniharaensis]
MTAPLPTAPASLPLPATLPLAARLPLLGLYPAKYRAAHGEEIATVFAEATEGVSRGTALREWAHLAAHALRLRTRLSSSDPAGRIAAGAAPFILAGGAGLSMVHLLIGLFLPDHVEQLHGGHPAIRTALVAAASPWILALACASLGRWTPARILVLLGILGRIGATLAFAPHYWQLGTNSFLEPLPFGFVPGAVLLPFGLVPGTLLLIAPPDAVDLSLRGRRATVLTALAIAVPMSALAIRWSPPDPGDIIFSIFSPSVLLEVTIAWPAAVMSLALLVHLGARRPDILSAVGIALAVLPWTAMFPPAPFQGFTAPRFWSVPNMPDTFDYFPRNVAIVLAFLATATLLAALHRSRHTDTPEPA